MSKLDFTYFGPNREPLCGGCVDKLYGDPHEHGGNMPDGTKISRQYLPEEGPTNCSNCGGTLPRAAVTSATELLFAFCEQRYQFHTDRAKLPNLDSSYHKGAYDAFSEVLVRLRKIGE